MSLTILDIIGIVIVFVINCAGLWWFRKKIKLDLLKDEKNDRNN